MGGIGISEEEARKRSSRIMKSFRGFLNYEELANVVEAYLPKGDMGDTTIRKVLSAIEQLRSSNPRTIDKKYEDARKIAMVTACFSTLAHYYQDREEKDLPRYLREHKDYLMQRLGAHCLQEGIPLRLDPGKYNDGPTLQIDIPYVGNVGWHFGRLVNLKAFERLFEREYDIKTDPFHTPEEEKKYDGDLIYSNMDLLLWGANSEIDLSGVLNETDSELREKGYRTHPIAKRVEKKSPTSNTSIPTKPKYNTKPAWVNPAYKDER